MPVFHRGMVGWNVGGEKKGGVMPQATWMKRTLFAAFALVVIAAVVAGARGAQQLKQHTEEPRGGGGGEKAPAAKALKIALLLRKTGNAPYETTKTVVSKKLLKNQWLRL